MNITPPKAPLKSSDIRSMMDNRMFEYFVDDLLKCPQDCREAYAKIIADITIDPSLEDLFIDASDKKIENIEDTDLSTPEGREIYCRWRDAEIFKEKMIYHLRRCPKIYKELIKEYVKMIG